jgi:hypothetical protein
MKKAYKKKPKQKQIETLLNIYAAIGTAAREQEQKAAPKPPPEKELINTITTILKRGKPEQFGKPLFICLREPPESPRTAPTSKGRVIILNLLRPHTEPCRGHTEQAPIKHPFQLFDTLCTPHTRSLRNYLTIII